MLYSFSGAVTDGGNPYAGLISDAAGSLYGTTQFGGGGCVIGCGTVFKLTPNGNGTYDETVLYRFTGANDGSAPVAGLIADAAGSLYGTTSQDGDNGNGTVFKIFTRPEDRVLNELPLYFTILFGITNDGGGVGRLPGGGLVHIPPRPGDPIVVAFKENLGNLLQAVELYEKASIHSPKINDKVMKQERAKALQMSIKALGKMQSFLKEEASRAK